MSNDASALLVAERRARALVMELRPEPGERWSVASRPGPDGAALLAAARLVRGMVAGVDVRLRPPEDSEPPPEHWLQLADSARLLGLVGGDAAPGPDALVRRRGAETLSSAAIPDGEAAWRADLAAASPFVRPAGPDERLYTTAESREADRRAAAEYGVPTLCLMENAAMGAAAIAHDMLRDSPSRPARQVLVVAGGGNNGGDGLALARGLSAAGLAVDVALMKDGASLRGDAAVNLALLDGMPMVRVHQAADRPQCLEALAAGRGLVIDALLGTGFKGAPSPAFSRAMAGMNACGVPVLALDLPSGIDADTGCAHGDAVAASRTIAFVGVKTGLTRGEGREKCGKIFIGDIGI